MKSKAGAISNIESSRSMTAQILLLIILFALMFANFYLVVQRSEESRLYSEQASELRVLSQRIAKNATEAAGGNAAAFDQLLQARKGFEEMAHYKRGRQQHWNKRQSGHRNKGN